MSNTPSRLRRTPPRLRVREKFSSMPRQHRKQQQCHDVGDFDHGVYGGAGGVFVGVADGVAGDGCLVGFAAFTFAQRVRLSF